MPQGEMEFVALGKSQRRAPAPWLMVNGNSNTGDSLAAVRKMSYNTLNSCSNSQK